MSYFYYISFQNLLMVWKGDKKNISYIKIWRQFTIEIFLTSKSQGTTGAFAHKISKDFQILKNVFPITLPILFLRKIFWLKKVCKKFSNIKEKMQSMYSGVPNKRAYSHQKIFGHFPPCSPLFITSKREGRTLLFIILLVY